MARPIIIENFHDTLVGQLLVATPQIQQGCFKQAVIYMCEHHQRGAMGIIINTPMPNLSTHQLLEQLRISLRLGDRKLPVMAGGPIEAYRGFVLHSGDFMSASAISSHDGITVTANAAVLTAWLQGDFTANALIAMGYAGWLPGQLEAEIETGHWVVVPATDALLFNTPPECRWDLAIASLGFDMGNLSYVAGHA